MATIYAGQLLHADDKLKKSSSGGIAYALSEHVLKNGGIVFGAAYDNNMRVTHIAVEHMRDIPRLQGSKYVQSDIGTVYRQVKDALEARKKVLFIGVGCQVAGLIQYLDGKTYSGLMTCDLLCGGGTSPGLFEHYIAYLEEKYKRSMLSYNFRDKQYVVGTYACSMVDTFGHKSFLRGCDAGYVRTMGAGYIRKSCFKCRYASLQRVGDISIGDFWNATKYTKEYDKGVSLIFANSAKGKSLLAAIEKRTIWLAQHTDKDAHASQSYALKCGREEPKDYDAFFMDAFKMPWPEVYRRYLQATSWKMELIDRIPIQLTSFLLHVKRSVQMHGK